METDDDKQQRDLEAFEQRIGDYIESDDTAAARRELLRARRMFPGNHELDELELLLLSQEGRLEEALELNERMLSDEPHCLLALREQPTLLMDLGRFSEARTCLDALIEAEVAEDDEDAAELHHDRAICLDREGKAAEAEADFEEAARLEPLEFAVPLRLSASEFDALVAEAVDSIPEELQPYLRQVAVVVREFPSPKDEEPFLLGLYVGVPRTERTQETDDHLDTIQVFKRNHELLGQDLEELREEVRRTVIHEVAHHFGLEEDEMGEYE